MTEFPLGELANWLHQNPPHLREVLGAVCEVYHIDPCEISRRKVRYQRDVFLFVASDWAGYPTSRLAEVCDTDTVSIANSVFNMANRVNKDKDLRSELYLIAAMLAERVLARGR